MLHILLEGNSLVCTSLLIIWHDKRTTSIKVLLFVWVDKATNVAVAHSQEEVQQMVVLFQPNSVVTMSHP